MAGEDGVECPDDVVAVQEDGTALTGAAARNARKQRQEERDKARLQRMSQSVAARRAQDVRKSQKQSEEEARLLRVAQKAAARRAAKGGDAGGEPGQAEGDAAGGGAAGGGGAGAGGAPQDGQPAKPPAQEGGAPRQPDGEAPPRGKAARRREGRAARAPEQEAGGRGRSRSREQRRQERQERQGRQGRERRGREQAEGAEGGGAPEGRAGARAGGERRHRRAKEQPAERPASAEPRAAARGQGGAEAGEASGSESSDSSSSSSSSSSSPSSPSAHAMAIAKAMATGAPIPFSAPSKTPSFAWERTLIPSSTSGLPTPQSAIFNGPPIVAPLSSSTELEQFLQAGGVDGEAAVRLRQLPPQLQRMVMDRGPVAGTRNPSSVVISRVKEVEALRLGAMPGAGLLGFGALPGAGGGGGGPPLAPIPEIEGMISRYNLDAQASARLRSLPLEQQRLAAKLPVHEARNPSAFVLTQLSMPRLLGTGEAARLPTQPHDPTAMMISGMLQRRV